MKKLTEQGRGLLLKMTAQKGMLVKQGYRNTQGFCVEVWTYEHLSFSKSEVHILQQGPKTQKELQILTIINYLCTF